MSAAAARPHAAPPGHTLRALPSLSSPAGRALRERVRTAHAAMNVPSQTLYVQNLNEKTKKQGT